MKHNFLHICGTWFYNNDWQLLMKLAVTLLVLTVINFIIWGFAKIFQKRSALRNLILLQSFFQSLTLPLSIFIWVAGLAYSLLINTDSPFLHLGNRIIALAFVVNLTWTVSRMISLIEKAYSTKDYVQSKQQREVVLSISRIMKIIVLFFGVIALLQTFDISVSGLVAFGGISAAGVTFAAKDILGNFFGGLMIFLNRPFSIGDWIRSEERNIEGTVEKIGWILTRIRTFDQRPLYVPNGIFSQIAIENAQRMLNRRIKQIVGVRYEDANKIVAITDAIRTYLQKNDQIDQSQTMLVDLVNIGNSSLDILIYTFTKTTDWVKFQAIQQVVFLKIIEIITEHGAECASPTLTVDLCNTSFLNTLKGK